MISRGVKGLALVVLAVSLTACSGGQAASTTAGVEPYEGGEISEAQYKGIVQYARDCMEEKGYPVGDVYQREDELTYTFDLDGSAAEMGDVEKRQDDLQVCESEMNYADAEIAYQDQNVLSGAEREERFTEFSACMAGTGVEVTAADDGAAVREKIRAFVDAGGAEQPVMSCYDRFSVRLYGFE